MWEGECDGHLLIVLNLMMHGLDTFGFTIGSIQGWGTQKECLAPKLLSRHYFEWSLHLWNNSFDRIFFI
jgi:hypothetical protein